MKSWVDPLPGFLGDIFNEETMAIIKGKPSGTAITMMIIPKIIACTKSESRAGVLLR